MKVLFVPQAVLDDLHVECFDRPPQPDQVLEAKCLALPVPLNGRPRRGSTAGAWLRMVRDAREVNHLSIKS